jgi:oxygen-independent coproporphyrinogen-3 oxidase
MHVPFCDTLCWFCGCNTKITQRYEPVKAYLGALIKEIADCRHAGALRCTVTQIHWGGGSPTLLTPEDIDRLARRRVRPSACAGLRIRHRGRSARAG